MANNVLTPSQISRLEKADAITRAQFDAANRIVMEKCNGWQLELSTQILAALVQAQATNFLAVVQSNRE